MNAETFCEHFATFADAPNGIAKLRALILQLAVQGKLVPQDESDQTAADLVARMEAEWERRADGKRASRQELLPPVDISQYDKPVPKGWEIVPFGNAVEIVRGVTFPASAKGKTQTPGTVACLRTTNVQDEVDWDDLLYIPQETVGRDDQWILPNDILISMANSYALVGKVALVRESHPRTTFGGFIAAIRPLCIDPTFVVYVLRSPDVQKELRGTSSQTTNIANISLAGIRPIAVPIPPLAEQRRIVEKVDQLLGLCDELAARQAAQREKRQRLVGATLDRLVSTRNPAEFPTHAHRLRNHFDQLFDTPTTIPQLRQTILQLAVQGQLVPQDSDDAPASLLIDTIVSQKADLVREKKVRNSNSHTSRDAGLEADDLPLGWSWVTLDTITEIGTGGTPPTGTKEYYQDGTIPWITSAATNSEFINQTEHMITERAVADCGLKIYPAGSLVVALYGQGKTRGQVGQLMFDSTSNQACAVIRFFGDGLEIRKKYHELRDLAAGGAQPNLNGGMIRLMRVPLPPLAEQKRIVTKVIELLSLCDALEAKLTQAESASTQLLSAAVHHLLNESSREGAKPRREKP